MKKGRHPRLPPPQPWGGGEVRPGERSVDLATGPGRGPQERRVHMGVGEGGASLSVSITGDLKLLVTTASPPSFLRGGGWISRNISGSGRGTASVMTWGEVEGGWKESWVIRADPKLGSLPHASGQPAPGCCRGRASHHCQPLAKPCSLACQESFLPPTSFPPARSSATTGASVGPARCGGSKHPLCSLSASCEDAQDQSGLCSRQS